MRFSGSASGETDYSTERARSRCALPYTALRAAGLLLGLALHAAPARADELDRGSSASDVAPEPAAAAAVDATADADAIGFAPSGPTPGADPATDADAIGFGQSQPTSDAALAQPVTGTAGSGSVEPSPWTLSVALRFLAAGRVEATPQTRMSNLRQVIEPRLEYRQRFGTLQLYGRGSVRTEADFAYLSSPAVYDAATQAVYAWQVMPAESYVSLGVGVLELSVGEQIVNFGQADMLSVLDVVNPRDLREPLLNLNDRLPLLMTRAKLSIDRISAEAVIVHEPYFGLRAPPLGEFSPFRRLVLGTPAFATALMNRTLSNESIPARDVTDIGSTQAMGRLSWSGPNVDLALLGGSLLDGLGVPGLPPAEAFRAQSFTWPTLHPRYSMLGHSGAWTLGSFVLRWELVVELQRALALQRVGSPLQWSAVRRHGLRGLLGLLFAPSESTNAGLEVTQSYVIDNPALHPELQVAPLFPATVTQIALHVSQRFLRDRASVSLLVLRIGLTSLNAWAGRVEVAYQLADALEVSAGYVTYQPTAEFGFFYGFDHHDRVFVNMRWDVSS